MHAQANQYNAVIRIILKIKRKKQFIKREARHK